MSSNPIQDRIKQENENDQKRVAELYEKLFDFLDTLDIPNSKKGKISDYVNQIGYYYKRLGLQKGVEAVNEQLSAIYWSCRSSEEQHYWKHELVKSYGDKIKA